MSSEYVLPTKIYLMELKQRLATIRFAKKILERKRDSLREAIKKSLNSLSEVIKFLKQTIRSMLIDFVSTANQYKDSLQNYALIQNEHLGIDVIYIPEGGVLLPKLRLSSYPDIKDRLPEGMRALFSNFIEKIDALLEAAEILASLELLLREIEITNRIVNTLDKVLIPDLQEKINYISTTLSEFMISELTSLRVLMSEHERGD